MSSVSNLAPLTPVGLEEESLRDEKTYSLLSFHAVPFVEFFPDPGSEKADFIVHCFN